MARAASQTLPANSSRLRPRARARDATRKNDGLGESPSKYFVHRASVHARAAGQVLKPHAAPIERVLEAVLNPFSRLPLRRRHRHPTSSHQKGIGEYFRYGEVCLPADRRHHTDRGGRGSPLCERAAPRQARRTDISRSNWFSPPSRWTTPPRIGPRLRFRRLDRVNQPKSYTRNSNLRPRGAATGETRLGVMRRAD